MIINSLSRTDIEKLIDEYEPYYYKGTDFKENAKRRILDGATFSSLSFNDPCVKPIYVFQLELQNFGNWALDKLNKGGD